MLWVHGDRGKTDADVVRRLKRPRRRDASQTRPPTITGRREEHFNRAIAFNNMDLVSYGMNAATSNLNTGMLNLRTCPLRFISCGMEIRFVDVRANIGSYTVLAAAAGRRETVTRSSRYPSAFRASSAEHQS